MEKPKRVWDEGTYVGELETRAAATGTRKRATSCGNEECQYKYNTYNFNKKLFTPPQSQSLSFQLRCVLRFVLRLSFVSLRCVCELLASGVDTSGSRLFSFASSSSFNRNHYKGAFHNCITH